jgi:hypothetical protein
VSLEDWVRFPIDTNMEETVTISKEEYDELVADSKFLLALRGAGVDNWEGYSLAQETLKE